MARQNIKSKKKKNIKLPVGKLFVTTSSNNTLVTLTDESGNKVLGGGTGMAGFKGTKESTPYAAEMLTSGIMRQARDSFGLKEISIYMKGLGMGRDGVFKAINDLGGIDISLIRENTAIQFGGCKGKRPKRN
ncbi:small ribosomal subunit protein uS11 [Candidatus Vampirococcus lugosii]|uniref:Small ribosomal subunit protein uS11 n=1 Tax=Candidatus Vampirococcus lugosii TaxID=2789015 RepID=A0ABS5QJP5_9BACT|nr:30S ribosomal protein S11 [Candidatus Vampirococcus lugosii]MBS8121443.1 30S ribosomal protein S11 [Candidatus Vampirococcus lugosii]